MIVMYGLRLFIVVLQELHCLPNCLHVSIIRVITSPSFVALHLPVCEITKCIACGCLLLFYENYIVYYNVYGYYCSEKYVYTKFRLGVSELYGHLCPYRNVWPEAVYCFTRTTLSTIYLFDQSYHFTKFLCSTPSMYCLRLFIKNYIVVYMLISSGVLVSITSSSFVALHLLVSENTL